MPRIPNITEQQLTNLNPSGLDDDFLARLAACAEGSLTNLSEEEAAFENQLRAIRPRTIPGKLHSSLLDTLGDASFAVDDKIVLFNKSASGKPGAGKARNAFRFNLAAAAAVALLGSLAALMLPAGTTKEQSADNAPTREPFIAPVAPGSSLVAPAGFQRNLSETRDEGVVWRGKNQPHRVLRLTYMDKVTVTDADGNPVIKEQPRVEYVIIPEKID